MANALPFSYPSLYSCAQSAQTGLRAHSGPKVVPGVPVSAWKQDDKTLRCGICSKRFGLLRWKHHCRACGDICCRRCLGFCLVDVPNQGVDLAYTCARCVQKNTSKHAIMGDVDWPFSGGSQSTRLHASRSVDSFATMAMSDCAPSPIPASPCSFASTLTPSCASSTGAHDYDVVMSQYRNAKIHSVCSLVVDYLDCTGGAIVLVQGQHLWVIAHKGLRSRVMHDPTFLSICRRALSSQTAFSVAHPTSSSSPAACVSPNTFQFFGAAPLFDVRESAGPALGCIVALDTRGRNAADASKVETTLENLADHVMDLLAREETLLRMYASGDFKIFASNAVDLVPAPGMSFDPYSSASSAASGSSSLFASMPPTRPRRSSSFVSGDEFFSRSAQSNAEKADLRKAGSADELHNPNSSKEGHKKPRIPFCNSSSPSSVPSLKAA
ncbi:hypothetical protein BBJ28_00019638 [Nothophytophthora sp. Chile5]|nr:hypothetical protein BBJ28_00019638 [Nothophytophthora sp. Chile5]